MGLQRFYRAGKLSVVFQQMEAAKNAQQTVIAADGFCVRDRKGIPRRGLPLCGVAAGDSGRHHFHQFDLLLYLYGSPVFVCHL